MCAEGAYDQVSQPGVKVVVNPVTEKKVEDNKVARKSYRDTEQKDPGGGPQWADRGFMQTGDLRREYKGRGKKRSPEHRP